LYKSVVRENLRKLSQWRFDLQLTLRITDLPLLVFGGACPATGLELRDVLSAAFSIARNLSCWKKCGAVPLTMAPLYSREIRLQIPVGVAAAVSETSTKDSRRWGRRSVEEASCCCLLLPNDRYRRLVAVRCLCCCSRLTACSCRCANTVIGAADDWIWIRNDSGTGESRGPDQHTLHHEFPLFKQLLALVSTAHMGLEHD
jgi:hypothetical protein